MKPSGAGRALSPGITSLVGKDYVLQQDQVQRNPGSGGWAWGRGGISHGVAEEPLEPSRGTPGLWLQCYRLSVRLGSRRTALFSGNW